MADLILPDAPWQHRDGLAELTAALGAGNARYVGGAVRDTLLGLDVHDIDIATPLRPEDVVDRIRTAGFKAVPTGIAHGTITAVLPSGPVEVTTLRRDVSTDGRHAIVEFADDWREDAARRDFTMNALYAEPKTGKLFDYFGGEADLRVGHVRFIGEPLQRIAEDHLRILRFFRFLARFGDTPDANGLAACVARANDLMALSRERIRDEVSKLVVAKNAAAVTQLMIDRGVLRPVLPEIMSAERLDRLAQVETQIEIAPDPIRRLAALLPREPVLAEAIAGRLKLSKAQRQRLVVAATDRAGSPYEDAYRHGRTAAIDRALLTFERTDASRAARQLQDWPVPRFPLSGGAIIARGVTAGPEVARLLRETETRWVDAGFPENADAIADAVVAQALRSINKA